MRRHSEQLFCFDTHSLRSLYPRFPPHSFFFTVQRLSLLEYRNCCKPQIIFATLNLSQSIFFPEMEGMMIEGTKEHKPHKKLEMRMLHEFIQCYNYVFSFILCSSPNSH